MKKIIYLSILILLFSCAKENNQDVDLPTCVQEKIDTYISNNEPTTTRATVEKYNYQSEIVYVCNFQNFPDGQSFVVNNKCQSICDLGGFDGPQNDCVNWDNAVYIETVWTDDR